MIIPNHLQAMIVSASCFANAGINSFRFERDERFIPLSKNKKLLKIFEKVFERLKHGVVVGWKSPIRINQTATKNQAQTGSQVLVLSLFKRLTQGTFSTIHQAAPPRATLQLV